MVCSVGQVRRAVCRMFQKWLDVVFAGCDSDWDYILCILLLLMFFDVVCALIQTFGKGARN